MNMVQNICHWLQTESKAMEQLNSKIWGIACGIAGGMGKYFLQIPHSDFVHNLIAPGVTALLCGLLGALGKHLFDLGKIQFWKFIKKLKSKSS